MRHGFVLDPEVAYFNHGSFGACSVAVFDEYQRMQRELEHEPTEFLTRGFERSMREARAALAAFVGARADDLVFAPNATSALNAVIRSLRIRPEEEILTTKHEYGAILRTLGFIRANVVQVEPEELIANIGIRTRAIVVSHITSPTAFVLPVEDICDAARKAGVLSIVDGAHVPGQLVLDVAAVGADVYAGNCHKWLCAPKGSGFLWARPEHQDWIEPLVISWGYHEDADFGERHGWQGTRDPAAYLAVPKAIEVHATFDLDAAAALADEAERRLSPLGLKPLRGARSPLMRALTLRTSDPRGLWQRLYDEHRVELPVYEWEGVTLARVSVGPYTDEEDIERLVDALRQTLAR
jgi:isopenicillin-N epimerase